MSHNCKSKKANHNIRSYSKGGSWLSALLIIILPKCPFCVMAYSGAVSLCSGKMLYPNSDSTSSYFILGFSFLILLGVLLNNRGKRTLISLILVSIGIILLMLSQLTWHSEPGYYLAVVVILLGIWNNGSLYSFINRFKMNYELNRKNL